MGNEAIAPTPERARARRRNLVLFSAASLLSSVLFGRESVPNDSPPNRNIMHALSVGQPALIELHAADVPTLPADVLPIEPPTTAVPPPPETATTEPPPPDTTPPEPDPPPGGGSLEYIGMFRSTCYDDHGRTADGDEAGPGSFAVDPRVIPLGTRIYVDGYWAGTADDTGGLIKDDRIDIWQENCDHFPNSTVAVYRDHSNDNA